MKANEDTFVFYPTFITQIEAVKNVEVRARLYNAVAQYGCYGIEPDFSDIDNLGLLNGLFVAIKYAIDESKSRRRNISEMRRAAGKLGGTTSKSKQTKANESKTSVNVNVNGNVNENVSLTPKVVKEDKEPKRAPRFVAPSLDEVKGFFYKNNFTSDPAAFYDHYTANGWIVGKTKMKDWQATARNWERRQHEFSTQRPAQASGTQTATTQSREQQQTEFAQHIAMKLCNRREEPDISENF